MPPQLKRLPFPATALLCLTTVLSSLRAAQPDESPPAQRQAEALFVETIRPLLEKRCFGCHGDGKELESNLDLRSRSSMRKGGDLGPALRPGQPEKSAIYQAVLRTGEIVMPPKDRNKLTKAEIAALRRWIAAGAPWATEADLQKPQESDDWQSGDKQGIVMPTSGGLSPDWTNRRYQPEDVWAYRPIRRYPVPWEALGEEAGPETHNPIDAFVARKLKQNGLTAAPKADQRTLLRRATLDLTGLPPTAGKSSESTPTTVSSRGAGARAASQSVPAAGNSRGADAHDAFEQLVERLLASPRYGEQMARRWLDVVRYADTSGFSNDYERPNAWRYRDYVIRSFNQDKPFDRFIVEQIAGDELDPNDPENLIAVGFLRMGPWEHTGMSVAAVTRQQFLDDLTHHVGVTFLGQALRCARCHDHKFDPVPTRDYYRMQAVFAPVQFADRRVPYQPGENVAHFEKLKQRTERRLADSREFLGRLNRKRNEARKEYLKQKGVKSVNDLPPDEQPPVHLGLTPLELSLQKIYRKRIDYFERELKRYRPLAYSVYNGPPRRYRSNRPVHLIPAPEERRGEPDRVHILLGGSLQSPADNVTPGVLSVVAGSNDALRPTAWNTVPDSMHGRRLALARWIASPNNTLTARVIVNRIWQQHFAGRGIVGTPNNLGKMGAKPTHPELLDWLATWFIEHGWSIKRLHKLIMTSETYQRSGQHPARDKIEEIDPENRLLAYYSPRRLAAEEIRDGLLAVTGELNTEMGGPGVFPKINREVALQPRHIMGSVAPAYQPSPNPEQRHRRTIYAFRFRTLSDPMLDVFDRPGSEKSCERRDETTVAPQAFALFNGQWVHDRALALANRLTESTEDRSEQIARAFRLVYGRSPGDDEMETCLSHVAEMTRHHRRHEPEPVALPRTVTREMVEELTGEPFQWEEELDLMDDYQPDLKPWDVDAETRGLAELCLVLLNSNEFLYVR